jgi:hypothetical protein
MPPGRVLSTIHLPQRPGWAARVDSIDRDAVSRTALVRRIVRGAPDHDAVVLDASVGPGERYCDLVAAIALARRAGPPVVLVECTWKLGDSRSDQLACRVGARLLDSPRTAYCVLSAAERNRFAATWNVDRDRVFFTPYCYTAPDVRLFPPEGSGTGVFAGGDSVRDYAPLVEAARGLDAPVTVASRLLQGVDRVPPNLTAGRVPFMRFQELTRSARVIYVALQDRPERSAGQQTYLNAMALGKLVVVPDVLGARDYIEDGRTGILVPPGDPAALRRTLEWALDDANAGRIAEIGRAAREDVLDRFSPDRYAATVLGVVDAMRSRNAPVMRAATAGHV